MTDAASKRLFWLKNAVILGIASSILLSLPLWLGSRLYPLTPIIRGLALPHPYDEILLAGLFAAIMAALLLPKPKIAILVSVVIMGVLGILDQSRWQPEFFEFFFLLLVLGLFSWNPKDASGLTGRILHACQLIICCTYIWSGLQKMNPGFFNQVFPWLLDPFIHNFPTEIRLIPFAFALPLAETLIGIALAFKKSRNYAVACAVAMHILILAAIGPFGQNWNTVIWPWNIAMMCFVVVLFWKDGSTVKEIVFNDRFPFHYALLFLFGIMPLFSFFGRWDSDLSFTVYSNNTDNAMIYIDRSSASQLPAEIKKYTAVLNQNESVIDIFDWSLGETNAALYPEPRIFKNIGRTICSYAADPSGVNLVISGRPYLLTRAQAAKSYSCSDLGV